MINIEPVPLSVILNELNEAKVEIERLREAFDKVADVLINKELTDWQRLNEIEDITRNVLWENKQ